jgi:hypothetical protein
MSETPAVAESREERRWVPLRYRMRKAGLRPDDGPPRGAEILGPLVLWSAIFELWLPHVRHFSHLATADPADILWYAIGGLAASVVWEVLYRERAVPREV